MKSDHCYLKISMLIVSKKFKRIYGVRKNIFSEKCSIKKLQNFIFIRRKIRKIFWKFIILIKRFGVDECYFIEYCLFGNLKILLINCCFSLIHSLVKHSNRISQFLTFHNFHLVYFSLTKGHLSFLQNLSISCYFMPQGFNLLVLSSKFPVILQ